MLKESEGNLGSLLGGLGVFPRINFYPLLLLVGEEGQGDEVAIYSRRMW